MKAVIEINFNKKLISIKAPEPGVSVQYIVDALNAQLTNRLYSFKSIDITTTDTNTVLMDLTRMEDLYANDLMRQAQQDLEQFIQQIPVPEKIYELKAAVQYPDMGPLVLLGDNQGTLKRAHTQFIIAQDKKYNRIHNQLKKRIK